MHEYGPLPALSSCPFCGDLKGFHRLYTPVSCMTSCLSCPDTKQISDTDITRTTCFSCKDGEQENEALSKCVDCEPGKYSDSSTDHKCVRLLSPRASIPFPNGYGAPTRERY